MSSPAPESDGRPGRASSAESWLPFVIGLAWWAAMYPGLFGEDSIINVSEAATGPIRAWFTVWWIYVIRIVSINGRFFPLVGLFCILTLVFAVREWIRACFPPSRARAWSLCILCATPLIGALGIQIKHDIPMTAGLLLCAAVLTRICSAGEALRVTDVAQLGFAVLLLSTRHNGLPTVLGAALLGAFAIKRNRTFYVVTLLTMAFGIFGVTQAATRLSRVRYSVDPVQSVEWALADISCLLTKNGVSVSGDEWRTLETIATREDWPQSNACRFMNGLIFAPSFKESVVSANYWDVLRVWRALAAANPLRMMAVHFERTRIFLPPFVTGVPSNDRIPFIHSTIVPNRFGFAWSFPAVANTVRVPIRAWNALRFVLASSGLWLVVLVVVWRTRTHDNVLLLPTILIAASLDIGLLATAPISEGRYGLFILICGQLTTLVLLFEGRSNYPFRKPTQDCSELLR
jgi:hypothetical protein